MRLHRLQVTAFGPFADTAAVDFDALSDAGLFLLTGPTGAGKTSVLDAVCFALYGEVPGDRQSAKRLRSDQAAPGTGPRVELEATLSGRRFRITRSPAWERPKRRGTGTTTEPAAVRVAERRDGEWHQLSGRLDETGHLVTGLVGMNLQQFCQVAMLPQGRFQAFLRAGSEERHKVLQQLFRTQRFEDVERWLRDRRRQLRQDSHRHHEVVADLVSRISESAGQELAEEWDLHDLHGPVADGSVAQWSTRQSEEAAAGALAAGQASAAASRDEERARAALERGRALSDLQQAHANAATTHERLAAEGPGHARRRDRLAEARRAAAVLPLHELAADRGRAASAARQTHHEVLDSLAARLGVDATRLDAGHLAESLAASLEAAARARTLLPREQELPAQREALAAEAGRVDDLVDRLAEVAAELERLPEALREARSACSEAQAAAHALPAARAHAERLDLRLAAASRAEDLAGELSAARDLLRVAIDRLHAARESWLAVQERRISGMAAELAGALAAGQDCPVCGSHDHPRPASAAPDAPDHEAERRARRLVDDAEAVRLLHEEQVRDLTTRLALAREQASGDDDPASALRAAEAEISRLTALAESTDRVAAELARREADHERLGDRREALLVELAAARASLSARQADVAAVGEELAAALAGTAHVSVGSLAEWHDALADACRAALRTSQELEHLVEAAADAGRRCERAAREAGFPDTATALASAVEDDALARLEAQVRDHDLALAQSEARLADPALRAAAEQPAPDLSALDAAHRELVDALEEARTRASVLATRARRLAGLDVSLQEALTAWAPVRSELELTSRVASLVDGTSPDNRLRMRLSGYVLAWRLGQVVAAANERLGRMSDHRYSLEHTGRRGAGENRGGLSLLVRDDWSGETRDPATLSGGETFVVSLALALGLADVITQEAGGADLDTLFVDEGFGSLDADTLDDVMDTLDTLRDGGRVVGVVSHVAEMRDRIPAQLRVTKSRAGSAVALAP